MADKLTGAKNAGLIGGGVLVFGLAAYLLYKMAGGLGDAAKGLSDAAGSVGRGAANVAAGVESVTVPFQAVAQAVAPKVGPSITTGDDYVTGRPSLVLVVLKDEFSGGFAEKRHNVLLRVQDQLGNRVQGAAISRSFTHPTTQWQLGGKGPFYTDVNGERWIWHQAGDLPFTDAEDDASYVARKEGYNASNVVTVV